MKKRSLVCLLLVLVVLLAGSAILWYTRPMTIQQLCPEVDLTQCSSITVYYEVVPSAEQERIVLEQSSPAFQAILNGPGGNPSACQHTTMRKTGPILSQYASNRACLS